MVSYIPEGLARSAMINQHGSHLDIYTHLPSHYVNEPQGSVHPSVLPGPQFF